MGVVWVGVARADPPGPLRLNVGMMEVREVTASYGFINEEREEL